MGLSKRNGLIENICHLFDRKPKCCDKDNNNTESGAEPIISDDKWRRRHSIKHDD